MFYRFYIPNGDNSALKWEIKMVKNKFSHREPITNPIHIQHNFDKSRITSQITDKNNSIIKKGGMR